MGQQRFDLGAQGLVFATGLAPIRATIRFRPRTRVTVSETILTGFGGCLNSITICLVYAQSEPSTERADHMSRPPFETIKPEMLTFWMEEVASSLNTMPEFDGPPSYVAP
jgi:hypothetical protein